MASSSLSTIQPQQQQVPQAPQQKQAITLIGLGAMGSALAHALLNPPPTSPSSLSSRPPAPITLTIHNRTPTRATIPRLTARGATFQPSLRLALAASSSIIIICLVSYAAIDEMLATLDGNARDVLRGKVVVNLTNGTPAQARALAGRMEGEWGVRRYVDGAVMATPGMVGREGGRVFVAAGCGGARGKNGKGEGEGWMDEAGRVLGLFGEVFWFGDGDVGAAAVQDLANLAAMYGLFGGLITALGLVKRCGAAGAGTGAGERWGGVKNERAALGPGLPSVQKFMRPLLEGILPLLDHIASEWDEGVEDGGPHPLLMQQVALQNILQACEEEGVDGGSLRHLAGKFEEAVKESGAEGSMTLVARKFIV